MTLSDRAAVSSEGINVDAGDVSGLNIMAGRFRLGAISDIGTSGAGQGAGARRQSVSGRDKPDMRPLFSSVR
jgi:hypothetical protein